MQVVIQNIFHAYRQILVIDENNFKGHGEHISYVVIPLTNQHVISFIHGYGTSKMKLLNHYQKCVWDFLSSGNRVVLQDRI